MFSSANPNAATACTVVLAAMDYYASGYNKRHMHLTFKETHGGFLET